MWFLSCLVWVYTDKLTAALFPTGPIIFFFPTFKLSTVKVCSTRTYDSASSVSLHFQSLLLPRCRLFTPAVSLFFCIFIIAALNLYFPPSSSLPLSFLFQLHPLSFCCSLCSISVRTREPVRGEYGQISRGCLKFTDWAMEVMIRDRKVLTAIWLWH